MAAGVGCAKRQWGAPEHLRKSMDPGSRKKEDPAARALEQEKKKERGNAVRHRGKESDGQASYEAERE